METSTCTMCTYLILYACKLNIGLCDTPSHRSLCNPAHKSMCNSCTQGYGQTLHIGLHATLDWQIVPSTANEIIGI